MALHPVYTSNIISPVVIYPHPPPLSHPLEAYITFLLRKVTKFDIYVFLFLKFTVLK